ncbi:MAG: RNA polymerase factor sigma-54 [Myxococcales bacterium]|jgi:RNA polymerase sigma-54 factor|nr:RNA polymerase factor sigma-54 [Myxococcales bacterium]
MGLELKQSLKLTHQLMMTPQLQQAIKMLQLSRAELEELIREELEKNPTLEEKDEISDPSEDELAPGQASMVADAREEGPPPESNDTQEVRGEDEAPDIDWEKFFENAQSGPTTPSNKEARESDLPTFEAILTRQSTLADHVLGQIGELRLTEAEQRACELIVGNLDEDGYLRFEGLEGDPIIHVAAEIGLSLTEAEMLLARIQRLDPVGVAARDLRECLMVQAETRGVSDCLVGQLIRDWLPQLANKRLPVIAKKLGVTLEALDFAMRELAEFEPKPGRRFSGEPARYITPDVYIHKVGSEFMVVVNDDGLSRLRISAFYRNAIRSGTALGKDREFIQEKLRNAAWLVRALHQRQRTILKVTESLVKYQREFLEKGIAYLKPLVLRDVAEDIGMHESTVSRITTAKYVHTPQGVHELKFFFNAAIAKTGGEEIANEAVRNHIKRIIANENPKKPYSDQKIVEILQSEGIELARRTVTKYREVMRIPTSAQRKKFI